VRRSMTQRLHSLISGKQPSRSRRRQDERTSAVSTADRLRARRMMSYLSASACMTAHSIPLRTILP